MLHLLHINDTEGPAHEVWPRLVTALRSHHQAATSTLLLHAGDIPLEDDNAPQLLPLLQSLHFDALALGNHDIGEHSMAMLRLGALPFVCANIVSPAWEKVRPYYYLDRAGWRIALIGITLPDLRRYIPARFLQGVEIADPLLVLPALMQQLRPIADIVILISHAGFGCDLELAHKIAGIDIIVGGHDHAQLTEPIIIGQTMIVQAEAHGASLGLLSLSRYQRQWQLLPSMDYAPDSEAMQLLSRTTTSSSRILGYTHTHLRAVNPYVATALNCLVVDLLRDYAQSELALLRCASIANSLAPGAITEQDLHRCVRCGADQVARLSCTGAELWHTLEQGAREDYYLLTISGARIVYDLGQPVGQRVLHVEIAGQPIELERSYSIACSEVLANGVGNFDVLARNTHMTLSDTIYELLLRYLQAHPIIAPAADNRLSFVNYSAGAV